MNNGTLPGYRPDPPPGPRPALPLGFAALAAPAPCVHDWAHAGVRWWLDTSDPGIVWVRYIDQFFCRRCLCVEARPIDYRHRLPDDNAVTPGTFAADARLAVALRDQAFAGLKPTAAGPAPASAGAPAARAD